MGGLAATAILSLCLMGGAGPDIVGSDTAGPDIAGQRGNVAQQSFAVSSAEEGLPKLVATRQMMFFIPFGIAGQDNPQRSTGQAGPKNTKAAPSVQLWVSEDRGQDWRLSDSVSPGRRGFLFRAKHDGEYWFLVRTVDPSGAIRDDRGATPEMRVLVDTQPPTLHLDAWRGDGGQICSRWLVDETYLQPDSLEVLYRTGPREQWRTLAIQRRKDNRRASADHGSRTVNWFPKAGAEFVQIRAKVVDMAGNTTISHAHVDMVDRPSEASGNLGKPNTAAGPVATRPVGPNRRLIR